VRSVGLCIGAALLSPAAHAGMPSVLLTEVVTLRLEAISFFVLALLLIAAGVQQLWNRATPLPRLAYPRSLGLVLLVGLLFHLVLTMISGARELMTPGAWRREGALHILAAVTMDERLEHMGQLARALERYVGEHGTLPPHEYTAGLPWVGPGGLRVIYRPAPDILAMEPTGGERLVIRADGTIGAVDVTALFGEQRPGGQP